MADHEHRKDDDRLDLPGPRRGSRGPRVQLDSERFGQFAESVARFMGTGKFLVYMTVIVIAWVAWNLIALVKLRWDPYPFILLNLFFSTQASYSAPLILLAQNRQEDRDRVTMAEDRRLTAQSRADMDYLAREVAALRMQMGELATRDYIRSEMRDEMRNELRDELRSLLSELDDQSRREERPHDD
ncbi:Integral membrane protein [Acidipropionibacterium acidipropionici ATCC 4875]|uniref:Integral membrane protein n=1 Tax=Acidipropionibacterium acidipropionici (strain ATCC 4875 / DSM 20272 / JCM 6432 / NBRC 12425 / NCIMB 8070 / 4) TaxID=1171373 RepID=K7RRN0_ACIA4|nr:DUF1003 domain-containing protein [Acidipropionibacterium acidipropionici]AFV89001.1 Integral membrane protein [Acidipropionibacterium acidipropionici ATCC 4875]ALN16410.1 hypothetical protein ASQ49_15300 [Acidipropionibacterium acidipropionici]APZ10533.1 hypothetical protein BWX38_16210 [Acidipropionibacterium acidipropionici]QCV95451.1 DUF1003 domain-containing protein [Acidipropionibacterium acidipropionici]